MAKALLAEVALEGLHLDVRLIAMVLQRLAGEIFGAAFLADETLLHLGVHPHVPFKV